MSVFQRAVPLALAIFSGVVGGVYTFKPMFDPAEKARLEASERDKMGTIKTAATQDLNRPEQ